MNIFLFNLFYSLAYISSWLDILIWFFAVPFIFIMVIIVILYYVVDTTDFYRKITKEFIFEKIKRSIPIVASVSIAWVVGNGLKYVFHTLRPFVLLPTVHPLFLETGYAFPSGHSTVVSALAFTVFFKYKRFGTICLILAFLVGVARVASGVHFPLDIIGGYALGFLVAFLVKRL